MPSMRSLLQTQISLIILLPFLGGAHCNSALYRRFDWDAVTHVQAFGDSYSFVLGTAGHKNFSFIGDAFEFAFTPETIFDDLIVANVTSSDGSNWLQFLTGCFSGSPLECDIQLWDFAFGGCDVDGDLLPLHRDFTIPLVDQVEQWVLYASNVIPHPERETLTTWWIGINDCVDPTKNTSTVTDFDAFLQEDMDSYFGAVQQAHDHGLHQHLFMNVPPIDLSPLANANATLAVEIKSNILKFNAELCRRVANFQYRNKDALVMSFDVHALFLKIINDGEAFGFRDTTSFCTCPDTSFFWWNVEHPTEAVHRIVAREVEEILRHQAGL